MNKATSLYLLEHSDNPVDWNEWNEAALQKARAENKPLLVSIGYSACHWCHEMEQESFMDTGIARIMNDNFVCIKVDREERPDIDAIYMKAFEVSSGKSGGWPLNAFALPDGKAFFVTTYNSKKQWANLLIKIAETFKQKHALMVTQANAIANDIATDQISFIDSSDFSELPDKNFYLKIHSGVYQIADLKNGGIAGDPKFLMPTFTEFLLQDFYLTQNKNALSAAILTLKKMAFGAIYDQVGSGFFRYTTDSLWRRPHFEKMLSDNAQMVSVYAHAFQSSKDTFLKKVLVDNINFIQTKLTSATGGYNSSISADSEGGEGSYYKWNKDLFSKTVGNDKNVTDYFHISDEGNQVGYAGVIYVLSTPIEFANANNIPVLPFLKKVETSKILLLLERDKRSMPQIDHKILIAWNSLLIKGFADAFAATANDDYLAKAKNCAAFIEKRMLSDNRCLIHSLNGEIKSTQDFFEDYALTAAAFLRLYEVSLDQHWLQLSKELCDSAVSKFFDKQTGMFFSSNPGQSFSLMKKIETADNNIPSSNAVMAKLLYALGVIYSDGTYTAMSLNMFRSIKTRIIQMPQYYLYWATFAGMFFGGGNEISIVGKNANEINRELQLSYLPASVISGSIEESQLPTLQKKFVYGKTLIYVCKNKICKKPVERVKLALSQ
ncbi:MAG: thioredoxin domain-containing protein [Ferruginibacter sp.]